jgi:hypothetical protein
VIAFLLRAATATHDAVIAAREFGWVVYLSLKSRSRR